MKVRGVLDSEWTPDQSFWIVFYSGTINRVVIESDGRYELQAQWSRGPARLSLHCSIQYVMMKSALQLCLKLLT